MKYVLQKQSLQNHKQQRAKEEKSMKTPKANAHMVFNWVTDEFIHTLERKDIHTAARISKLYSLLHNLKADEEKLTCYNIYKDIAETFKIKLKLMEDMLDEYLESLIDAREKTKITK
jgi:hypothetical protein